MNYKNEFLKFLESDNKNFNIENDNKYYNFVKIEHSPNIDFIFMNENNYRKLEINDKLKYCGFYDKKNKEIYDLDYVLKRDIFELEYDDQTYKDSIDLRNEFNMKISEIIVDYVNDNKNEFCQESKKCESSIKERDVYQNVIDDEKEVKYKCNYYTINQKDILKYIDEGEQYLFDTAFEYIEKNRELISKTLADIDIKNEYLKSLYKNTDHPIHKMKEISNIIKDGEYVNVHLFINKNGIDYDFKYDASTLRNYWDYSYLPTYSMQAPDRKEFEKLYGPREDLYYEDIYKIEYRNKVIYEDKKFVKNVSKNTEDLTL